MGEKKVFNILVLTTVIRLFNKCTTLHYRLLLGNCGNATIYLNNNLLTRFEEATFKEVPDEKRHCWKLTVTNSK